MPASLFINGAPEPDAPPSAGAFLRVSPRGAYTALTVVGGEWMPHWQWHTERLASSLVELADREPAALPAFAAWHGPGGSEAASPLPLASHLSNAALPSLAVAVRAVTGGSGPGGGNDVGVVILVCDGASNAGQASQAEPPVEVRAYAWALPPPSERAAPGGAAVVGPARTAPAVKDSAWAVGREAMEAALQPGAADGILAGEGGVLLEGLVTNLFVVQRSGGGGGGEGGGPATLRTASPADGALDGVLRRAVLDLARAQGLAVDESPPNPADSSSWTEAFLTNAVRGVQPLTCLVGPGRGGERGAGAPAWQVTFDPVPGPVTAGLAAALPAALAEHATRLPRTESDARE